MRPDRIRIAVDTGGTFTDCIAETPDGQRRVTKILSHGGLRGIATSQLDNRRLRIQIGWDAPSNFLRGFHFHWLKQAEPIAMVVANDPVLGVLELDADPGLAAGDRWFECRSDEPAAIVAARLALGLTAAEPFPAVSFRHATTVGTNALLERRGARVALFVTRGFADILRIGDQQRPDLFARTIVRDPQLCESVVEVKERIGSDGQVLQAFEPGELRQRLHDLVAAGIDSAAVALLHSNRYPQHEQALGTMLSEAGFRHVSLSSELTRHPELLARTETAAVDAYLGTLVAAQLNRLATIVEADLEIMTSAGGLVPHRAVRAKDCLMSGPAGGVTGAAEAARRSGFPDAIAFDMGGTSTDVARTTAVREFVFEQRGFGARIRTPSLAIESVAAGGGSRCWFDGHHLRVGPQSSGSVPGPACYGGGGPLTVTDVNLLLGRLAPDRFPIPLSTPAAQLALDRLRREITEATSTGPSEEDILVGLLAIVDENMAAAIRRVSIDRGFAPADHVLVAFGGAAGQHATSLARRLGVRTILLPPDAALLSATGVAAAPVERIVERAVLLPLPDVTNTLQERLREIADAARFALRGHSTSEKSPSLRFLAELRFLGQDASLDLDVAPDSVSDLGARFVEKFKLLFGYAPEQRVIELVALRAIASEPITHLAAGERPPAASRAEPVATSRAHLDGAWQIAPVYDRRLLVPGNHLIGPALVFEAHTAAVIETGFSARVDTVGALIMEAIDCVAAEDPGFDPTRLELFASRFRSIAEEMGSLLRRAAVSTNIKERLDFSCALLDADGELLVNAPHIPVHLGSLGLCVRSLREVMILGPGDVVLTNHPRYGGSHLPDVTVVAPVHGLSGQVIGYVASRAHHAEIGGIRPGSMPTDARNLAEEGVVLKPVYIRRGHQIELQTLTERLRGGPHLSRAVAENLADVQAALGACLHGVKALRALADRHGEKELRRIMNELTDHAEQRMRQALSKFDGIHDAVELLDDGTPLRVRVEFEDGHATIDFRGSGEVHPGGLNATPAIVHSVVLYVLRLLVDEPLPLNGGLLRAVTIELEPGILDPPFPRDPARCPAIVGGNVETSQRLVDLLLKAVGDVAASQGTMNNVAFGNDHFGYYETIGGGTGAGPGFAGVSAIHSHMTNTRITDPEIIEARYPVRVERFAIRPGSGGVGRHRGGDGAVRELHFLAPMSLSVLTQRRRTRPYGREGGGDGLPGLQYIVRANGERVELGPIAAVEVEAGDRLVIETPGGGGWGSIEALGAAKSDISLG